MGMSAELFTGAKITLKLIVNLNKEPEKQVLFLLSQYFLADHQKVLVTPKQLIIALTTAPPLIPTPAAGPQLLCSCQFDMVFCHVPPRMTVFLSTKEQKRSGLNGDRKMLLSRETALLIVIYLI